MADEIDEYDQMYLSIARFGQISVMAQRGSRQLSGSRFDLSVISADEPDKHHYRHLGALIIQVVGCK